MTDKEQDYIDSKMAQTLGAMKQMTIEKAIKELARAREIHPLAWNLLCKEARLGQLVREMPYGFLERYKDENERWHFYKDWRYIGEGLSKRGSTPEQALQAAKEGEK